MIDSKSVGSGDTHRQTCSTVQYSTVQYSTVQYSTVQYSTVQYSTVQYNAGDIVLGIFFSLKSMSK